MKYSKSITSIICVSLLMVFFVASCDQTADPASSVSTDKYPTVTVTSDLEGNTVTEGDTVNFKISMDKPPELAIPFTFMIEDGEATAADVDAAEVTYPANELDTVQVQVVFKQDNVPEKDESLSYKIGITDIGVRKLINPNSELPSGELTIQNRNDPSGLSVVLDWENSADDLDFYGGVYVDGSYLGSENAATGDKPEVIFEANGIDGGLWYYAIDPYEYNEAVINYTVLVGYPDQSIETYEGSFDASNVTKENEDGEAVEIDGLTVDPNLEAIRILKVVSSVDANGDLNYSVENLNPGSSEK